MQMGYIYHYSSVLNRWLMLVLLFGLTGPCFSQTIKGTVFRDFDANGSRTSSPTVTSATAASAVGYHEPGVSGVTIKAFTNTGTVAASAVSGIDGSYSLAVGSTGPFRVEFTGFLAGDFDSFAGVNNATSVQFVSASQFSAGAANGIDCALNYPPHFCDSTDPLVLTTCFVPGTFDAPVLAPGKVLVGTNYFETDNNKQIDPFALHGEMGSVWGLAFDNRNNRVFVAAFSKRHVGFGPNGSGAIYVTNVVSSSTGGNTTEFFNFSTIAGATAPLSRPDLPTISVPATFTNTASHDPDAFTAVGRHGLGDIDLSDDGKTLYVVNLVDRKLYAINTITKAATGFAIPNPCGGQSYRPFALKYYRGQVYVGVTCTREDLDLDANNDKVPDSYGSTPGLSASVYAFNGSSFVQVLSFPLDYKKQPTNADKAGQLRAEYWRPWASEFMADRLGTANDAATSYPQPWLTDIEFDVEGSMLLGIRDRFGDQLGFRNYEPDQASSSLYSAISTGEILRAGQCGAPDSWSIEQGGQVCGAPLSWPQQLGPSNPATPALTRGSDGPGGGKYYWGDRVKDGANHATSSMGSLAMLAGGQKVLMAAVDPTDNFTTGGLKRLINATGAKDGLPTGTGANPAAGVQLYGGGVLEFGKANGVGDVEVLCGLAPIQIGNRVWHDLDNDGVQDAGEPALAGVVVQLKGPGVPANTTAVTNGKGEYYFSNASGANTTGFVYSLTGLTAGSAYSLCFPSSYSTSLQLSGKANQAGGANADAIDTDANSSGVISFSLGQAGQNNFSYDAAYVACGLAITAVATCQTATNQYVLTGTISLTNQPAGSLTVTASGVSTVVTVAANQSAVSYTLTGSALQSNGPTSSTVTVVSSASECGTAIAPYFVPASCFTCPALSIVPSSLPNAQANAPYSQTLNGVGGQGPYSFSLASGSLPANLTLSSIGVISGIPVTSGITSVTVRVTDSRGCFALLPFTLTIGTGPACSLNVTAVPSGCQGPANTYTLSGNVSAANNADPQTLTIGVGNVTTTIVLTGNGPTPYSLTGLPATGNTQFVTVNSPAGTCGAVSQTFAAPAACTPLLDLEKAVNIAKARVGGVLSYTVRVSNSSGVASGNLVVQDVMSDGLSYVANSATVSTGTFTATSTVGGYWTIPGVPGNTTITLTYSASVLMDGVQYNVASIPGDEAKVCTTIPLQVCKGTPVSIQLDAPAGYTRYQWYLTTVSGTTLVSDITATTANAATANSYTATRAGEYKVVVDEGVVGSCPDQSCCPIVIEEMEVPFFTAQARNPGCVGSTPQANGQITLLGLEGTTGLTFQVSLGTVFNASTATTPQSVPTNGQLSNLLAAGAYTVRVTDAMGCFRDATVALTATCGCPPNLCMPLAIRKTRSLGRVIP